MHTGVKSFGCENSTAHESPIQSWKRIRPSVVSASKSGAVAPICSDIVHLLKIDYLMTTPNFTTVRATEYSCRLRHERGGAHMTYYGGKELAASFRTVRDNTITDCRRHSREQVRLSRRARHALHRADACAHRADSVDRASTSTATGSTTSATVNFPGAHAEGRRRGSQAAQQGGNGRVPEVRGRALRVVPGRPVRLVSGRDGRDAARRRTGDEDRASRCCCRPRNTRCTIAAS